MNKIQAWLGLSKPDLIMIAAWGAVGLWACFGGVIVLLIYQAGAHHVLG